MSGKWTSHGSKLCAHVGSSQGFYLAFDAVKKFAATKQRDGWHIFVNVVSSPFQENNPFQDTINAIFFTIKSLRVIIFPECTSNRIIEK